MRLNRFTTFLLSAVGMIALLTLVNACTEYDTPDPIHGDIQTDSISTSLSRRVLWINIDGASGTIMQQAVENGAMPNVSEMLKHSKYTWQGISDSRDIDPEMRPTGEDPITWASMLTGVNSNLHSISDYSYTPNFELATNPVGQKVTYFPTVIQYLATLDQNVTVSTITPWSELNRYLGDSNSVTTTSTDEETFSTAFGQISNDDYRFFILSFKGVLDAGREGGFTSSNTNLTASLTAIDSYIGQLIKAIDERANSPLEDWLIVITSNHGGSADGSYAGLSDENRNIFGLFYFNHYSSQKMQGEILESIYFKDHGKFYGIVPDTTGIYSLNEHTLSLEYTFQNLPSSSGSYTSGWAQIMGKAYYGVFRQWDPCQTIIRCESGRYGGDAIQSGCVSANDMFWHHFYYSFDEYDSDGRLYMLSYDGKIALRNHQVRTNVKAPLDTTRFVVGVGGVGTNYRISTIRIWNTISSDVNIAANSSNGMMIDRTHPDYKNLLGEWTLSSYNYVAKDDSIYVKTNVDDRTPTKYYVSGYVKNNIDGSPAMYFTQHPEFVKVANTLPAFLESGNLVMENTLVASNILYWFCGTSGVNSKLCGYPFLKNYAIEEQWRQQ